MRSIPIRSYRRRDGTVVSEHTRRLTPTDPFAAGPPKGRLELLADPEAAPTLPRQPSEKEISDREYAVERARRQAGERFDQERRWGETFDPATFRLASGAAGASAVAALALAGLPFVALPVAGVVSGALAFSMLKAPLLRRLDMYFAGKHASESFPEVPSREEYRREAAAMAERYPHWFDGERPPASHKMRSYGTKGNYEVTCTVDEHGVADVAWTMSHEYSDESSTGQYLFYPGVDLSHATVGFPIGAPGVNLRGANLRSAVFLDGRSNMDGADLRGADLSGASLAMSLRHANLQGASLVGTRLANSDLTGADLTGADVTGAQLPLDLTGTNITRDQFVTLRGVAPGFEGDPYKVREADRADLVAAYGGEDELKVAMWAGDVEIRERATSKVVVGEYDPAEHYIPHWAVPDAS